MKVAKFGGTSLADAAGVGRVCDIVASDPDRRVMIVSAPGKRDSDDTKVTDMLIACAESALRYGQADDVVRGVVGRYAEIQVGLGLPGTIVDEIDADIRSRLNGDRAHAARFTDTLKAAGEDNCARLVAEALRRRGVDAHYVSPVDAGLVLSDEFGNARVLPESFENLRSLREREGVTVFPGFFGTTPSGGVATFPRGGSDITGAIVAAAIQADLYENFTDVDSVFAADPRIVAEAQAIHELTYREMRELSYAGFAVFHDEAIMPAVQAHVPICIKNTHRPDGDGTRIVFDRRYTPGEAVGIAAADGFCSLFVEKYLMNREVGFGRRLLAILEDEGLSFEHVPSGIDSISVILREAQFDEDKEGRVLERVRSELEPDDVSVERGLALIMIVGEGMHYAVGVAARATRAFAEAGVNIEMINQGSSEISMMFGIKADDRPQAVRAIYDAFFNE